MSSQTYVKITAQKTIPLNEYYRQFHLTQSLAPVEKNEYLEGRRSYRFLHFFLSRLHGSKVDEYSDTMTACKKNLVVDHLSRTVSTDSSFCCDDDDSDDLRGEFIADLYLSPKPTVRKEFFQLETPGRVRAGSFEHTPTRRPLSARLPPILRSMPSSPKGIGIRDYDTEFFESVQQSLKLGEIWEPRRTKSLTIVRLSNLTPNLKTDIM